MTTKVELQPHHVFGLCRIGRYTLSILYIFSRSASVLNYSISGNLLDQGESSARLGPHASLGSNPDCNTGCKTGRKLRAVG